MPMAGADEPGEHLQRPIDASDVGSDLLFIHETGNKDGAVKLSPDGLGAISSGRGAPQLGEQYTVMSGGTHELAGQPRRRLAGQELAKIVVTAHRPAPIPSSRRIQSTSMRIGRPSSAWRSLFQSRSSSIKLQAGSG
jgi:hypothetical protein